MKMSERCKWPPAICQVGSFVAVCFQDANITFQSIDGVLFDAHKKDLIYSGPGFLKNTEFSIDSEGRIHLAENSSALELLLQYIYPYFWPSLDDATFDVIEALGNAAEKYEVRHATIVCRILMQ